LRNAEDDPIDAAWLIDTIGSVEVRLRAERLDQLSFGQRVFAGAAETSERGDVLVALRAFSRYRMLLWTVERIGIRAPEGDSAAAIARPVAWEGQGYRLDLGAAERRRLQRVREKQEGVPLDAALDVAAAGRALRAEKLALDDAESIVARLSAVVTDIPRRVGHDGEDSTPTGLTPAPNAADALRKAIDELSRDIRNKDVKKAAR